MSQTPARKIRSDICRERLRALSSDLTVASWADRYRVLTCSPTAEGSEIDRAYEGVVIAPRSPRQTPNVERVIGRCSENVSIT